MLSEINLKLLVKAGTKFNLDHICHTQKLLLSQQKYYEFGNKSSRLLAF